MGIEIISLTNKGEALSHSVRHSGSQAGWQVIYFLKRLGGRTTFDRICQMIFGGNEYQAKNTISMLKAKGIVVGE